MPFYYNIDNKEPSERRIAEKLLVLKDAFKKENLPQRTVDSTLMLATWNIRELDSGKYGARGKECLYYIAEIISRFDLVAVQEVRDDLTALNRLMKFLGSWWKVILTDVTEGKPGNRERMAFIYDSHKINFGGLAGEIIIPPTMKKGEKVYTPADQLARSPFAVGFQAGWFKFVICTCHIVFGDDSDHEHRRKEIDLLAKFLADRTKEKFAWAKNMIVLGDFNISGTDDATFKALTSNGFTIPKQIQKLPSNVAQNKHYDQIAFIAPDVEDELELCSAGIFNYYKYIYKDDEQVIYEKEMGEPYMKDKNGKARDDKAKIRYYKDWRTFQMSDHLPMWIELKTDFGEEYLKKKTKAPV